MREITLVASRWSVIRNQSTGSSCGASMVEASIFENSLRDPWEFAFGGFRLLHSLIPDELLSDCLSYPIVRQSGHSFPY